MTHSLTLGSLLLTGSMPDDEHGFTFDVLADGVGFGVAQGVREVVTSLLADGDLVRTTRFGNREVSFAVQIEGPTLAAVAQGEAALRREVGRGNTLTWAAPDVLAVPTAFDVIDSEMEQSFDDLDELKSRRTFVLTLTCSPFARSVDAVTVAALDVGDLGVDVVDTCDSAAGWSGFVNGAAVTPSTTWSAGAVSVFELLNPAPQTLTLIRSGSVDLASRPYLVAEIGYANTLGVLPVTCVADGRVLPAPAITALGGGFYQYRWHVGEAVSTLEFSSYTAAEFADLKIREVSRDGSPSSLPRQSTRVLEVGGTERTPASIHVQTPTGTGSLFQAIVHTCPEDGSGYSPPLRRWRTSASTGPETASASAYSGFEDPLAFVAGGFNAKVPTSALPEGGYVLMARVRILDAGGGTATIFWSTSTIFPGSTDQQGYTNGSTVVDFPNGDWTLVPLAALSLPSVRTSAGQVDIALQASTTNPAVSLDEAWLFRADDDCGLTIVDTDSPHLWLDSADTSSPVPTVWVGDDEATRVHPGTGLRAMGQHVLSPEGTAVFTAAYVDNPATDATFYRRWHSNAAS